jgi:hypothetical protein
MNNDKNIHAFLGTLSDEEFLNLIRSERGCSPNDIIRMSEYVQMKLIKWNLRNINCIPNPTEKIKKKIIKKNPYMINEISNASDKLKLFAIKQDGRVITIIKNPTDEMIIAAGEQLKNQKGGIKI